MPHNKTLGFSTTKDGLWPDGRARFENTQTQVSAMDPHHAVRISYPHTKCINQPDEKLVLLDIDNAANRYAPKPLTASKTVEMNAGRGAYDQRKCTPHYLNSSVEELTECWEKVVTVQQSGETMDYLIKAMKYAEAFVGGTFLEVTTITTKQAKVKQVLVHRISIFHRTRGQDPVLANLNYMFPLATFERLRGHSRAPSWWYMLDDLLYRKK